MISSSSPLVILLLGENGVGKTSFCREFLGIVDSDYSPTIGLDIYEKDVTLPGNRAQI
jgi:GTPase SAR1 family protein